MGKGSSVIPIFLISFFSLLCMDTKSIYATTIVQPKEPETITKSVMGVTSTNSNATTTTPETPVVDQNSYFHDKNLWVIGDSLAVGWDGKRNVLKNYPTLLGEKLQPKTLQAGYSSSGSQISGNQNGSPTFDLTNNVTRVINDSQYANANALIIELGVNDLNYSSNNLGYVQQRLKNNIQTLRHANPNIKIYGVLPLASYQTNKTSSYSMGELQSAITAVYESFGIPVLNWNNSHVVNGPSDLGDQLVHPSQKTYEKMANFMSNWLLNVSESTMAEHDSREEFVSNGWQTDESGEKQFAENNHLVTGLKKINNKTYFFDKETKGLVKNQFVTVEGHKYYIGSDGSVSQSQSSKEKGIQVVDGQAYEIDSNGRLKVSNRSGYLKTIQGWRWLEKGKPFTGFRHYMGTYYWFVDGVRQDSGWRKAWNYTYYTNSEGRAVSGYQLIDGHKYYFGNDGTYYLRTGQKVKINRQQYYANSNGILTNWSGYQNTDTGWHWYEKGKLFTGFRYYMGTYYWFENGDRINSAWRKAWNYQYYVDNQGRAVQGKAYLINNIYYNFGTNGTFYLRGRSSGYLNTSSGWRWIEKGQLYTGFRKYMGAYYYFKNGVRQQNQWVTEWGKQYYVGNDGRSVEGHKVNINNKYYDFGTNHTFYLRK